MRGISGKLWVINQKFNLFEEGKTITISKNFKDYWPQNDPIIKRFIKKLQQVFDEGKMLGIIGDYDVDGVLSTGLLVRFLKTINWPHKAIIPDRFIDGYGPSIKLANQLIEQGAEVIITLDSGTSAHDLRTYLENKKIPMFIIDHHHIDQPIKSDTFINSKLWNDNNLSHLCATGLTFVVLAEFNKLIGKPVDMQQYTDFAAIGTICDVMELVGLNRCLVANGIDQYNKQPKLCFQEISKQAASTGFFGFIIGPHINAAGRLGKAMLALELITSDDSNRVKKLAIKLIIQNSERKQIEDKIFKDVEARITGNETYILFYSPRWHEGVIGIVAGRLKEKYNIPVGIFYKKNGVLKGSLRSPSGFHLGDCIAKAMEKKILIVGGGHSCAGGCSLLEDNWDRFVSFFEKAIANIVIGQSLYIEATGTLKMANKKLCNKLDSLGPFGPGNFEPRFIFPNCRINFIRNTEKGAIYSISDNTKTTSTFIYNKHHLYGKITSRSCHIVGKINQYDNNINIQIVDISYDLQEQITWEKI